MPRHRTFDEITYDIEHARPVHPVRALFENHFYLDGWVSSEGGLSLAMFSALLFVPVIMFGFFYPIQVLIGVGGVLVAAMAILGGLVLWRRHARRTDIPADIPADIP